MSQASDVNTEQHGNKFGTFGGVFTPSILTIFGLIMFMRTGYVVGKTGLIHSLVILFVAQIIVFATGLSISAVSTNTPVKGGGAYFLISRVLGPGFGSAIGVTLFVAQSLSVPFYILGFAEAVATNFPVMKEYYLLLALAPGVILFILAWSGASWAIKCQYFILVVLGLSIASFLLGALFKPFSLETLHSNLHPVADADDIFIYFAIFFPAVTGIMAGVNMSGDLKNPAVSIPRGTIAAILVGGTVYALQMILSAGAFSRIDLIDHPYSSLVKYAVFGSGFLVFAGVVAATISSALGSFLGAPRVLQALGRDNILKVLTPFGHGSGKTNEPRRALIASFIITIAVLIWGGIAGPTGAALNHIASVVAMFFLYTYGMVNLAAFVESYGSNPSFRPRFKYYHWSTALFGAAACIIVSFLINAGASIVALIIIGSLFMFARRKQMKKTFGDARRGFVYSRIRDNLIKLVKMPPDPKNWRPTIAVLTGNPNTRFSLLEYACLFECNCGIVSLVRVMLRESSDWANARKEELSRLRKFCDDNHMKAFPEVVVSDDFDRGLDIFLQAHSLGPIKPNIIMTGWPNGPDRIIPYTRHLKACADLDMSTVIMVNKESRPCPKFPQGRIDLWWRGRSNGSLMLILAYLLCSNQNWNNVKLRVIRTASNEDKRQEAHDELEKLVESARINADIRIIISDEPFDKIFCRESKDAVAVFMGFLPPDQDKAESFYQSFDQRLENMPTTFLISSSGEADLMA